jgi:hypothetical protein
MGKGEKYYFLQDYYVARFKDDITCWCLVLGAWCLVPRAKGRYPGIKRSFSRCPHRFYDDVGYNRERPNSEVRANEKRGINASAADTDNNLVSRLFFDNLNPL